MKTSRLTPHLALLLAALPVLAAQESPTGTAPAPANLATVAVDPFANQIPQDRRFDLDLPAGLPAEEAIRMISDRAGTPVNVVWAGDSAATELPGLRLHQVTVRECLAALSAAGRAEARQGNSGWMFEEVPEANGVFSFVSIPSEKPSPPPGKTIPIKSSTPPSKNGKGESAAPARSSRFFDLAELVSEDLKIEDITTAIHTAWTAEEDGKEPPRDALKYHLETSLLVATGSPERLQTVEQLISLLEKRNAPSMDTKDRRIEQLQRGLEISEHRLDEITKARQEAETAHAASEAKLRERVIELEIELAKLRAR
jgi:hypothetical protein